MQHCNVEKIQAIYFSEILPSKNKHIFLRSERMCLFWKRCLIWVFLLWVGTVSADGLKFSFEVLKPDGSVQPVQKDPFFELVTQPFLIWVPNFQKYTYKKSIAEKLQNSWLKSSRFQKCPFLDTLRLAQLRKN